ncbi:helix-turn-helix transcriptional regulator [Streptomyces sp. NPDC050743]|uniref:helix-turn-helix transcriptional regulator n=1 Tax=Streptomyces sp. NPDC050743 TaxID=3365634 RepID=UPI0037918F18
MGKTGDLMDQQARGWGFLTNHAHVLRAIARNPDLRLRDIAAACDITERTVQSIVTDLEQAGYLSRERDGRRTRYSLHLDDTLRHPADAHLTVRELLELLDICDQDRYPHE